MVEKIKWYFLNVIVVRYVPMAVLAGMAAIGTWLAAHAGILEQYGVTFGAYPLHWAKGYTPSGNVILIELDTLSIKAYTALIALVGFIAAAISHHTVGAVAGPQPQDGGKRENDPPKEVA